MKTSKDDNFLFNSSLNQLKLSSGILQFLLYCFGARSTAFMDEVKLRGILRDSLAQSNGSSAVFPRSNHDSNEMHSTKNPN